MNRYESELEDRRHALNLIPVSRETEERFAIFAKELRRWQHVKSLVGNKSLDSLWTRHIADSAQLRALAPAARIWIDLGSGGGFPGLILAIMLAEEQDGTVHLIEANSRKCAFLRTAARLTGARAEVLEGRIEEQAPAFRGIAEVVTARALAPLATLIGWGRDLLTSGTLGLFPKGQDVEAELTEASKYWRFDADIVPSRTDATGRIIVVRGLTTLKP